MRRRAGARSPDASCGGKGFGGAFDPSFCHSDVSRSTMRAEESCPASAAPAANWVASCVLTAEASISAARACCATLSSAALAASTCGRSLRKGGGGGFVTHAAQLGFTLLQRFAFLLLACERRGQHLRAVCQAGGSRWELRCKGDASEPREVALVRGTGYSHGAVCRH